VILGVTGDEDATGYKRRPIVPQDERVAIVSALRKVDQVVCPCPLIVTKEFMEAHGIDLVVHGFANDADAERQKEFFEIPIALGKFQRIGYYCGLSTTDRIRTIQEQQQDGQQQQQQQQQQAGQGSEVKNDEEKKATTQSDSDEEKKEDNSVSATTPSDIGELQTSSGNANRGAASAGSKPQWFGAALAAATNNAPMIPTDPFPLSLRNVIEPHIEKARKRRQEALNAIRIATGESVYDSVMKEFLRQQQEQQQLLRVGPKELLGNNNNSLDDQTFCEDLVSSLLLSAGLPLGTDLSKLHEEPLVGGRSAKDRLLHSLTQNPGPFQRSYDAYVLNVCIPRMTSALEASKSNTPSSSSRCEEIYYQVIPCLRIVQPDEFSIGPHADVAYGHHPCSINCYVSLTDPVSSSSTSSSSGGNGHGDGSSSSLSSSLFLESRPGAEDWHALFSGNGEEFPRSELRLKLFAGAMNLHWTTENKTPKTRVSLDFRLLDGRVFHSLECGGYLDGGQTDVYRKTPGYYHRCFRSTEQVLPADNETQGGQRCGKTIWSRDEKYLNGGSSGEFPHPDFRVGFPWTVKNWEKFWKKNTKPEYK